MNKIISLALIAGGIALIVIGINASNSFGSDVSRFFTGSPTDKSVWLMIGGVVALVVGAGGTFLGSKKA
ncbi:MAG: rane protein [Verrucomicrobiales bacterium]|nr:rane protein [Verrucomicrobiales bacterium]